METTRGMAQTATATTNEGIAVPPRTKRVNLNLALRSYEDLERLSEKTDRTMTDTVRFGLALVKLYLEETEKGNKLIIASPEGKPISEIRFPD
jgi:hypothetical protein